MNAEESHPRLPEERLVERLLRHAQVAESPARSDHLSDETVAQFCEGSLSAAERSAANVHLIACEECRATVSFVLHDMSATSTAALCTSMPTATVGLPGRSRRQVVVTLLSLAASLLVAFGIWRSVRHDGPGDEIEFYAAAEAKLKARDFAGVSELTAAADRRGQSSSRLRNLRAQAVRRIPDPSALAYAGKLSDFGIELGGVVARGPQQSEGMDAAAALLSDDDHRSLLNRGHLELGRHQVAEARRLFQQAAQQQPTDAEAWLGVGLAEYMADDFAAAEAGFAKAAALAPGNLDVRWNQAMTLEELDRGAEAAVLWRAMLRELTDDGDRRRVEAHLALLPAPKP